MLVLLRGSSPKSIDEVAKIVYEIDANNTSIMGLPHITKVKKRAAAAGLVAKKT